MKPITIAVMCPQPEDPTSWYRGVGPLTRLSQANPNIKLVFPTAVAWSQFIGADILFLQRPCAPDHFNALVLAKDMGIKVWCDIDDDNLSVGKDNPMYATYAQLPMKDALIKLARHCDVLTTTTEFMKRKYGIYNKNCLIIPNALDDKLLHLRQIPPGPRQKRVMWRGTSSHLRNLLTVGKQILSLSRKYEDWKFTFFGMDPIDLTDQMKNFEVVNTEYITNYMKVMCQLHAAILYYPLGANDHAQARSHISWLEGTFAGSQVVASKNAEFTRPGLLNFSTPDEFESVVDTIIGGGVDVDKNVEDGWAEIQDKYLLSKTNVLRMNIIESLL